MDGSEYRINETRQGATGQGQWEGKKINFVCKLHYKKNYIVYRIFSKHTWWQVLFRLTYNGDGEEVGC